VEFVEMAEGTAEVVVETTRTTLSVTFVFLTKSFEVLGPVELFEAFEAFEALSRAFFGGLDAGALA
jgi:hypothetical protein